MIIKNKTLDMLYITIFVIISGYGLFLALGINEGKFLTLPLSYSNLSSIICFSYFTICLIHGIVIQITGNSNKEISILPHIKGAVTMCVIFTLIIFHFILFRGSFYLPGTNSLDWRNLIIHYITPIMAILHWLLFDKKGIYRFTDIFIWLAIPIMYLIFSLIYAEVGTSFFYNATTRYPYFFINPDQVGWINVSIYIVILIIFFLFLGYLVFLIDKYLAKLEKAKR